MREYIVPGPRAAYVRTTVVPYRDMSITTTRYSSHPWPEPLPGSAAHRNHTHCYRPQQMCAVRDKKKSFRESWTIRTYTRTLTHFTWPTFI